MEQMRLIDCGQVRQHVAALLAQRGHHGEDSLDKHATFGALGSEVAASPQHCRGFVPSP